MSGVKEYVVAALLHDVGKLIRRARLCQGEPAKRHAEHSVEFVEMISDVLSAAGLDVGKIKELVARHHEGDFGIAPYDRAAAKERVQGDEEIGQGLAMLDRGEHEIPLLIHDEEGARLYVPPCPLPENVKEARELAPCAGDTCVPREKVCECYKRSYEELMRLAKEVNGLKMSYGQLVETLVHILKATATFVPAAVYGVKSPNTSLFAHSVLAAALASTGGEFVVVSLDLGKIQEYISRARTTTWAMSILRGRSLHITMLQKVAVRRLKELINKALGDEVVTYANVLLDTGGEVLMLIPPVKGLEQIADQLEEELLADTEGVLTIYVTWRGPYPLDAISYFDKILKEIDAEKAKRKLRYRVYPKPGPAGNAKSAAGAYYFHDSVCDFCGRPAKTSPVSRLGDTLELCDRCRAELDAGLAARNLNAVAVLQASLPEQSSSHVVNMLDKTVLFVYQRDPCVVAALARGGTLYAVNTRRFICKEAGVGYGFIYTNQHVPTWEELAMREGRPVGVVQRVSLEELDRIYYVKMDANAMGRRKSIASKSPSLLITFATAVSMAYELYPALLAGLDRYRDEVFVVYAGGDDAYLAGSITALDYVSEVVKYSEKWGFRTAVGVKLESSHYPVYYAYQDTEERLKRAKEIDREQSIAVFSTDPLLYTNAAGMADTIRNIRELVEGGQELEGEDRLTNLDRALRMVYVALLRIYNALDECGGKRAEARRRIAETLISLVYAIRRRGEDPERLKRIVGIQLDPEKIAQAFAPALKCDKSFQAIVADALLKVNFAHQLIRVLHSTPA